MLAYPSFPRLSQYVRYCCSGGSVPTVEVKLPVASEATAKHAAVGHLILPEFLCTAVHLKVINHLMLSSCRGCVR